VSKKYPSRAGLDARSEPALEFGSERIPRSLLRGKRAHDKRYCSLRIEDSPQQAAESFNVLIGDVNPRVDN
jgi:hypothetical protein